MPFPAEIKDTIASNLVEFVWMADLPGAADYVPPSWDALLSHLDRPVMARGSDGATHRTKFAVPELDVHTLLNLRQVSRGWRASADLLLAKHHHWTTDFDYLERLETALSACAPAHHREAGGNEATGNVSTASGLVRKLVIPEICDVQTCARKYEIVWDDDRDEKAGRRVDIEGQTFAYRTALRPPFNRRGRGTNNAVRHELPRVRHHNKNHEHRVLRRLFDSLEKVESFGVAITGARSWGSGGAGHKTECYDPKGLATMVQTIRYGLRSHALSSLSRLDLEVPTTHDVAALSVALGQDSRDKLQHLRLVIVDQTGPSGSHEYTEEEDNWDGALTQESVFESGYYPSNWQIKYPNQQHQDKMFDFVRSCRNLESLQIEATQFLDLDMLASNWSPNLKVLSLTRFWTRASSLVKLLSAPDGSGMRPRALRASLHDIKIRAAGGDWSVVFGHLRERCPDLEFAHWYQLAYLSGHPHYSRNNRPWENVSDVWTENETDYREQNALIKCLVAKAGGVDCYPWLGRRVNDALSKD